MNFFGTKSMRLLSYAIIIALAFLTMAVSASAITVGTEDSIDTTSLDEGKSNTPIIDNMEGLFSSNGLEYYAYMVLSEAPEELKPIILEARSRIILRSDWVDDELDAWVRDEDGNIIEVVPHFSEVFPSDWEIPVIDEIAN